MEGRKSLQWARFLFFLVTAMKANVRTGTKACQGLLIWGLQSYSNVRNTADKTDLLGSEMILDEYIKLLFDSFVTKL